MAMTNLTAFITGGAQGMGRAYAEVLLTGGAAKVYIADVNEEAGVKTAEELQSQFGKEKCQLIVVDVTNAKQFEDVFQAAVIESGHIDLMVNNAGMVNEMYWEPVVHLNYIALVRGTELAMRHMSKKNGGIGGRIINTCSNLGLRDFASLPVYTGTKHAIRAYTSSLAMHPDQEDTGVQLATICPGPTDTVLLGTVNPSTARYMTSAMEDMVDTNTATPARIAEGFAKLLRMPRLNGAILYVDKTLCEFCRLEYVSLGPDWAPPQ